MEHPLTVTAISKLMSSPVSPIPSQRAPRIWVVDVSVAPHLGKGGRWDGEPAPEGGRWSGDWLGDIRGLNSPVCSRQSSSSLVRLNRFFSLLSFSTCSWRLAFSSESCLRGLTYCRMSLNNPWSHILMCNMYTDLDVARLRSILAFRSSFCCWRTWTRSSSNTFLWACKNKNYDSLRS